MLYEKENIPAVLIEAGLKNLKLLILLSGKAGSGKTTSAFRLNQYLSCNGIVAMTFSFSKYVKMTAYDLGWNDNKDELGRNFLADIGMVTRKYHPHIWVVRTLREILYEASQHKVEVCIIDDCRFKNEIEVSQEILNDRKRRVFSAYMDREVRTLPPGVYVDQNNASETGFDNIEDKRGYFDSVIDNNKSLGSLDNRIELLGKVIIEHYI